MALPIPPAFVTPGGQRGSSTSSDICSSWHSGCLSCPEHERRLGGSQQRHLVVQATTAMPTPVMSSASRWLSSPFLSVAREEGCCSGGDQRRRASRVRSRDDGAVCDESRGKRRGHAVLCALGGFRKGVVLCGMVRMLSFVHARIATLYYPVWLYHISNPRSVRIRSVFP